MGEAFMPPLLWIASIYAIMSIVTFAAYGLDKHQAERGKRRISERTLHLLELMGGWPGAAVGQGFFRHKRRKFSYMVVFISIVFLHVMVWVGWSWMVWRS